MHALFLKTNKVLRKKLEILVIMKNKNLKLKKLMQIIRASANAAFFYTTSAIGSYKCASEASNLAANGNYEAAKKHIFQSEHSRRQFEML